LKASPWAPSFDDFRLVRLPGMQRLFQGSLGQICLQ
jgi:hypothetical protein